MDAPEILSKRVSESLFLSVDFAAWLETGESLSSITSITVESVSGVTVANEFITGTKVQAQFTGGVSQESISRIEPYCVTVIVTTTGGPATQTYVSETGLMVLEDC